MKHRLYRTGLAADLLLLAPTILALGPAEAVRDPGALASQAPAACGSSSPWDLRGTYTFTATAWQNLSEINPALPRGDGPAMKVDFMMLGTGPGSHVELDHATRISMKFE